MGYARTKLEEAAERVKALEAKLEAAESEKKDWCSIADNLEKRLDVVEQDRDSLKAKLEAADSALDGRLGIGNPDAVRQACQEYVAAEDQLPEWCDGEDYRLSKAVAAIVCQNEALQKENEQLKKSVGEALETLEAFSRANSWGERLILEPSIDHLKALRNEHPS